MTHEEYVDLLQSQATTLRSLTLSSCATLGNMDWDEVLPRLRVCVYLKKLALCDLHDDNLHWLSFDHEGDRRLSFCSSEGRSAVRRRLSAPITYHSYGR